MTTPDEARKAAHDALTPERRHQLACIADRYRVRHQWYPAQTRAQQDADFNTREHAHEKEQERRQ